MFRDKQTFYCIIQGNCVTQRDPDLCKGRELELFFKVAWLFWLIRPDINRKPKNKKFSLYFQFKKAEPQGLYIRINSTYPPDLSSFIIFIIYLLAIRV